MTNNINIIAIYDQYGNITNKIILEAKESTTNIRIRYSCPAKYTGNVKSIKVLTYSFGDVINTVNNIVARQGDVLIVDSIMALKYPSNTSVTRLSIPLDYSIEGEGLYFSTLNDASWKINIEQPTSIQIELATLSNYTADLTRYIEQDGLKDGNVLLGSIIGYYIDEVWLESLDNFDISCRVEKEEMQADHTTRFSIYLTNYPPNYTGTSRRVRLYICGKSGVTGNRRVYTDPNLTFTQLSSNMNPDLKINLPYLNFGYKGNIITGSIQYTQGITVLGNITTPSWLTLKTLSTSTTDNITTTQVEITVPKYTGLTDREGVINISSTYNGSAKSNKTLVKQYSEPGRTNLWSCSDAYCNFEALDVTQFSLCDDDTDTVLYTGYAYPIGGVCNINLKDVINNYISSDIQFLSRPNSEIDIRKSFGYYYSDPNSSKTFYVKVGDDIIQTFHVVYNWSFEPEVAEKTYLQMPIQGIMDYRQYGFLSRYHFNEIKDLRDEDTIVVEIPYVNPNLSFVQPLISLTTKINNVSFRIPQPTVESYRKYINRCNIKVNSEIDYTFKICQSGCWKYCLYYLNKFGGIDWFLFDGVSKESRSISNNKVLNNRYYAKTVTRSWNLKTGFLKNWQSKLMPNLLESTCLYLHDLEKDEVIPVNITDTKYDLKLLKNNSRKFYNYSINVEEISQKRIIC